MSERPLEESWLERLERACDAAKDSGAVAVSAPVLASLLNEVRWWRRAQKSIRDAAHQIEIASMQGKA